MSHNKSRSHSALSIILPAYNEADLIGQSLIKLNDYLSKEMASELVEVLVIINSPVSDGTLAKAQEAVASFKPSKNHKFIIHDAKKRLGKGGAVKLGMQMAEGKYRLFMDADLAIPAYNIPVFLSRIKSSGSDIVIASRSKSPAEQSVDRALISFLSGALIRILVLPGLKDTQCGFKMFTSEAADLVFSKLTSTSWSFDMEALLIAKQNGLNVSEISINEWADPKKQGLAGDNKIKVLVGELKELFRFWKNKLKGSYLD